MATPAIPKRVLVTAASLRLFDPAQKGSPFDIPEEYRLEWHEPVESGVNDQDEVLVVLMGCALGDGVRSKHWFTLGKSAWITPKEATDALVKRLADNARRTFNTSEDCTDMIARVRGDADFLLRDLGVPYTLGRVMSAYEGILMKRLGDIAMLYSTLLHQQCDLEHELRRREQGLIKED